MNAAYTINPGARVGTHTLTLTTAGGSATGTFYVYDPTPINGYPLADAAWGLGLMQLTNPYATPNQAWNWQANITAGMALWGADLNYAIGYWNDALDAYNLYFKGFFTPPPPGNDSTAPPCVFSSTVTGLSVSGSAHAYSDAIALKKYNSATITHNYIGFNVPNDNSRQLGISPIGNWSNPGTPPDWTYPGPPSPWTWYVQQLAGNGTNYVQAICKHGN